MKRRWAYFAIGAVLVTFLLALPFVAFGQVRVADDFSTASGISTQSGSQVTGGQLQNTDVAGGTVLNFDAVNDELVVSNSITSLKALSFWFYADDNTSRVLADCDGTRYLQLDANGDVAATGWTSPIVYLDGVSNALRTVQSRWHHMLVTTTTGINTTNLCWGNVASSWFDGMQAGWLAGTNTITSTEAREVYLGAATMTGAVSLSFTTNSATVVTNNLHTLVSETVSTSRNDPDRPALTRAFDSYQYQTVSKPGGTRAVVQVSQDSNTWYNAAGKVVNNAGAYSFDGVDDIITVADHVSLDVGASQSVTWGIWVKTTQTTRADVMKKYANAGIISFNYNVTPNKVGFYYRGDDLVGLSSATSITSVNDGRWHFVVGVRDALVDKILIYVDGVEENSTTDASTGGHAIGNLGIGASTYETNYFLNGLVDSAFVITNAITATQIQSLMRGDSTPADLGAVSWWKLDGNAQDSIGSNHGTVSGATSVTDWARLHQFGDNVETNAALHFDGTGDWVSVPDATALDFGTNDFSVQVWVKLATLSTANGYPVIKSQSSGSWGDGFFLQCRSDMTRFVVRANDSDTSGLDARTTTPVTIGVWTQLAGVRSGSNVSLYVNGSLAALTNGAIGNINTSNIFLIGAALAPGGPSEPFLGKIGNVVLNTNALTATQILTDYQRGYPDATNAVAYWPLIEGSGTNILDRVGSNHGTISGNPQWVTDDARPIPFAPTTNTVSLASVASSWTNLYGRVYTESDGGEISVTMLDWLLDLYRRRTVLVRQ